MYYYINRTKKELGISKHSVDNNVVQEICDVSKLAGLQSQENQITTQILNIIIF